MKRKILHALSRLTARWLWKRYGKPVHFVCEGCGHDMNIHIGESRRCRYPGCWCGADAEIWFHYTRQENPELERLARESEARRADREV